MSPSKSRRRRPRKKKSNKKIILIVGFLAVVAVIIVVASLSGTNKSEPVKVQLMTNMGNIVIELRDDMPITTDNFKKLVQEGVYDNTIFHRVIDGFMIQGGDPMGTGQGDPSIPTIQDEFSDDNRNLRGTIAMAKQADLTTGQVVPDSASSQFFINLVDNNGLDSNFAVFGNVIEGMDVVDRIAEVETDGEPYNRPLEDVTLIKAQLVD